MDRPESAGVVSNAGEYPRILGRRVGGPGPTLFVTAMLHGNEPAGAEAFRRVMECIERDDIAVHGEVIGVSGNLAARREQRRYLRDDLNRVWTDDRVEALRVQDPSRDEGEEIEQRAVLREMEEAIGRARGAFVLLDLHTTSGPTAPFALMSDVLRNRRYAFALPVPVILGLEEKVDGTLLEYVTEKGHCAIVIETGQHEEDSSIDRHVAALWLLLLRTGLIRTEDAPDPAGWRPCPEELEELEEAARGLPRVVEVVQHHRIARGEKFQMVHDDFVGFQRVRKGETLGRDQFKKVSALLDGLLLMPRYQPEGNDGFFVVRRVRRFWLWVSRLVRPLSVVLRVLPGVSRHPTRARTLVARPPARWFVVELFHLFGYRKRRREGDRWIFTRRNE